MLNQFMQGLQLRGTAGVKLLRPHTISFSALTLPWPIECSFTSLSGGWEIGHGIPSTVRLATDRLGDVPLCHRPALCPVALSLFSSTTQCCVSLLT